MGVKILALALCGVSLFAGDSLVLTDGDSLSYTAPASSPWTALGSRRLECGVDVTSWDTTGAAGTILWELGDRLYMRGGAGGVTDLCAADNTNTSTSSQSCIDVGTRGVIVFRAQLDNGETLTAAPVGDDAAIYFELWDSDGSDYAEDHSAAVNSNDLGTENLTGTQTVGGAQTTAKILWCNQYSTLVEPGPISPMPDRFDTGDLGSWDFDGSVLTDDSSYSMSLSGSGHTFETTPTTNPGPVLAIAGEQHWQDAVTVRAGETITLTGSCSSYADVSGCTCVWSDQGGGSSGTDEIQFIGSTTACSTTAAFPTFGSYTLRLAATDDDANSTNRDFEIGVVASDSSGNVVYGDPAVETILGDAKVWPASDWPWLDERRQRLGNFFGAALPSSGWTVTGAGTVAVTDTSFTITGTGTDFQVDFCGGDTTPDETYIMVIDAASLIWAQRIATCDSATQITTEQDWDVGTASGLSYLDPASDTSNDAIWIGNSTNVNYYDNVMAFGSLYYQTGHTKWLTHMNTLAAIWWSNPWTMNEGQCREGPITGSQCQDVRERSITGLMLWAETNGTESTVYDGLEEILDYTFETNLDNGQPSGESRQDGYAMAWAALAHNLDPDGTRVTALAADIATGLTGEFDSSKRHPVGAFEQSSSGSNPSGVGTLSITNGSTAVEGSGTNFTSPNLAGEWIQVVVDDSADLWTERHQVQVASVTDADSLVLEENYTGTTRGAAAWRHTASGNESLRNIQPFMQQMSIMGLHWAHVAGEYDGRQEIVDAVNWLRTEGYWTAKGGYYTIIDEAGCEDSIIADTLNSHISCQFDPSSSINGRRYLLMETMRGVALGCKYARELSDSNETAICTFADTVYGKAFGKWGGTSADYDDETCSACYALELDEGQVTFTSTKHKNFGFGFGFSGSWAWDSIKGGGVNAESLADYSVPLDIGSVSGATKASVTLTEPKGSVSRVVNDATGSTVAVTGDLRQGDHLAKIEYKNGSETILQTDFAMIAGPTGAAATLTGEFSITGAVSF